MVMATDRLHYVCDYDVSSPGAVTLQLRAEGRWAKVTFGTAEEFRQFVQDCMRVMSAVDNEDRR